jgi:hypothetical protein
MTTNHEARNREVGMSDLEKRLRAYHEYADDSHGARLAKEAAERIRELEAEVGEGRELMTTNHEALREALAALEPVALFPDDDGRPDEAMSGMRMSFGAIRAARRAYALIEAALDTQTGGGDE